MSSWEARPPAVSCWEWGMARSPFSCRQCGQWPEVERELQREVTRILITPHCSATAGMPQVSLLPPLQKYCQAFTDKLLACLKSQLQSPSSLPANCLAVLGRRCLFWFSEHFYFARGKKNGFWSRQEFAFQQECLKLSAFCLAFGKREHTGNYCGKLTWMQSQAFLTEKWMLV